MSDGPQRCPVACIHCGAATGNVGWICDECKKPAPATASAPPTARASRYKPAAQLSDIDRMYHTKAWERCSKTLRACNAICQHIIDGKRCTNASTQAHHLVSPYVDVKRFFDPSNIVCVCDSCHRKSEGEPEDDFREYAPTRSLGGVEYAHPTRPKVMEVRIVGTGIAG